jgi:hypothetical protein
MYNVPDPQNGPSRKKEGKSEEISSRYEDAPSQGNGKGDDTSKKEGRLQDEQTNGLVPLSTNVRNSDPIEPALISPIGSHEPLLGYPNGIGVSTTRRDSVSWGNHSMGERLLGKMSSMVSFATADSVRQTKSELEGVR